MGCYRKILRVSYKDHVTKEKVCAKIQQATGSHEDLLMIILQGTVKEGRRQGRQRKRWEDNFREWTGREFAKLQRAVDKKKKWRKLVGKSSVVPQSPSWLGDR